MVYVPAQENTALISKTTHLHVLREILASAVISLITKTTHCMEV